MLTEIKNALKQAGISVWSVERAEEHTAELFFIRRRLDTRRMKDTVKYHVRVYRDFEKDGKAMRGMASVSFAPGQEEQEILTTLREAYDAAAFVENPAYPLPEGLTGRAEAPKSRLAQMLPEEAALEMAEAAFSADHDARAFLNTMEVFAVQKETRLLTSQGTDVAYGQYEVEGEFVTQCKEPEDVEVYRDFHYDDLNTEELKKKVAEALQYATDRTAAVPALKTGSYDVILSDDCVAEILSYYVSRSQAGMIYAGYSQWKPGDPVQPEEGKGEQLNLTLHASVPYSDEGIPMKDRPVVENGKLLCCHGGSRFASYLGTEPTGDYSSFVCENGTVSMKDMKKKPFLWPVIFSDFQMDDFSGHFGGEIRLAYWFDGERPRIVTGGSVNGSLLDCGGDMIFSTEKMKSMRYEGPRAVLLKNISIAGSEE